MDPCVFDKSDVTFEGGFMGLFFLRSTPCSKKHTRVLLLLLYESFALFFFYTQVFISIFFFVTSLFTFFAFRYSVKNMRRVF